MFWACDDDAAVVEDAADDARAVVAVAAAVPVDGECGGGTDGAVLVLVRVVLVWW